MQERKERDSTVTDGSTRWRSRSFFDGYPWDTFFQMLYLSVAIQSCYWIIVFRVGGFVGNKFGNGIILSLAGTVAALGVGVALRYMHDIDIF